MSPRRRATDRNLTTSDIGRLLAWLPLILVAATGIAAWVETRMTVAADAHRLATLERMLSVDAIGEHREWKVNVERDIKELRADQERIKETIRYMMTGSAR